MKKKGLGKILSLFTAALMAVSVVPVTALASGSKAHVVDKEWYNFRNNQENNGVTDRPTPTNDLEAALKWAEKYGTGWAAAPTPPLILDGYLYIGMSNKVLKINKETGEKVDESDPMAGSVGFAMNPILYADGKLFVQVGAGMIQALDYETLDCVWKTEKLSNREQTVSPISYTEVEGKGYIYTGTWSGENRDGTYFCVSTDDENLKDSTTKGGKEKAVKWKFVPSGSTLDKDPSIQYDEDLHRTLQEEGNVAKRGFYWAGSYACEKYIAVGSDDGTSEGDYTANGVFYTLNPATGEIIDKISGIKGDIRSTVVYDNGHLYFNTKGGLLYKVDVDDKGNLSNESFIDLGGMTTAAPLVYKNKIYLGVGGKDQFNPDGGHSFKVVDNSGTLSQDSLLYELPIQGYPQAGAILSTANEDVDYNGDGKADGRVYIYFTYNANPGGIYYTYDTPDQKEAAKESKELFVPEKEQQQYCISTLCADREGTLYYKNDSCYLMAVETNEAYLNHMTAVAEDGTTGAWNQAFDSKKSAYEVKFPTGTKKVEIKLDLIEGSAAVVNDIPYKDRAVITLDAYGKGEAKVTVSKGDDSRTYTLALACQSENTDLAGLKVNNMNSASGGDVIDLTPELAAGVYDYTADVTDILGNTSSRRFWNVWPVAADKNAKITMYPVENVDEGELQEDGTIEPIQAVNAVRYPVYPKDKEKTVKVRIDVTSENGKKTQSYNLTLLKKVDVTGVTLNHSTYTMDVKDTLQMEATIAPADASYQTVKWYSLDETVAAIDENGLVTPKKAGKTTITVITDDQSKTAACELTVTDKDLEAAQDVDTKIDQIGEVTLESKADIDVARAAYEALTQEQKDKVTKYDTLLDAEKKYQELKEAADKEAADRAAAKAVDDKIEAIGNVTLEKREAIQNARTAYDELSDDQKAYVTKLQDLKDAEKELKELEFVEEKEIAKKELEAYKDFSDYRQAQQDELRAIIDKTKTVIDAAKDQNELKKALEDAKADMDAVKTDAQLTEEETAAADAQSVMDQINAIGNVTLNSKTQIEAARTAYDALSELAKTKVTNLDVLEAAEKTYKELVEHWEPEKLTDNETGITAEGKVLPGSKLVIRKILESEAPELLKAFEAEQTEKILSAYEVSLENGGFDGNLKLTFPVGDSYNGRKVIIKHLNGDGTIGTYAEEVKDGTVSVTVDSLDQFMLALAKDQGVEPPDLHPDQNTDPGQKPTIDHNKPGTGNDQLSGDRQNPSLSPKTNDPKMPVIWILFVCAAGAGITAIAIRRRTVK